MKIYLVISLLLDLLKNEKISAKALAEKYEVSPRTIYRYLDYLECAGIPTITYLGKNGGIGIDNDYKLNTTFLTIDEKSYLKGLLANNKSSLSDNLCKKLQL